MKFSWFKSFQKSNDVEEFLKLNEIVFKERKLQERNALDN